MPQRTTTKRVMLAALLLGSMTSTIRGSAATNSSHSVTARPSASAGLVARVMRNSTAAASIRVGAIFLDAQGFYGGVKAGFQNQAKKESVSLRLIETNTGDDVSKESSFISTMVSTQVQAIILSAASSKASMPAIRSAYQAGIPVVCYNTCIDPADIKKYVYAYAYGDPVKFGAVTGALAAQYFLANHIRTPQIGIINCEFVEVCIQRHQGFWSTLKAKVPGAQIVANQQGTTSDQSVSVAGDVLSAHPHLSAFYGESGGATIGAVKAVQARGLTGKVVVFGSDMTTDIAKALLDGPILKGEADVSGKILGALTFDQVRTAVNGGGKSTGKIVTTPIDSYSASDKSKVRHWVQTHADGLP